MTRRRPGRLPRWQEWTVYVSFGSLIATGIAWLLLEHFVRIAGEFGPEPHPAEHWALVVHGIVAYAFLVVIGTMIPVHVVAGWNSRRNLKSGVTFAGVLLVLVLSALGLYYVGDELSRHWISVTHWVIGLVAVPTVLIHALKGRRSR